MQNGNFLTNLLGACGAQQVKHPPIMRFADLMCFSVLGQHIDPPVSAPNGLGRISTSIWEWVDEKQCKALIVPVKVARRW